MQVEQIILRDFRVFHEFETALARGVVAIVGPNATGKTTILEAIFAASAGRSPRTHRDADMVRWGAGMCAVEAMFRRSDGRLLPIRLVIELAENGLRKRIWLADKTVRRAAELLTAIPLVLFTPADLTLAQGEPRVRRRFMNLALARLRPAYADDLARYRRAVLQRNKLLRDAAPSKQIEPWTTRLIESGARVAIHRRWFAESIAPIAAELHASLSRNREKLAVEYAGDLAEAASDFSSAVDAYRQLVAQREADERAQGRTLVGPHRDDLRLTVDGQPVRLYGSQGQQRTAALALKLAEAQLLWHTHGESPILLLDDCLSELDDRRGQAVLDLASRYDQILVTSASDTPMLASAAQFIRLNARPAEAIESETQ